MRLRGPWGEWPGGPRPEEAAGPPTEPLGEMGPKPRNRPETTKGEALGPGVRGRRRRNDRKRPVRAATRTTPARGTAGAEPGGRDEGRAVEGGSGAGRRAEGRARKGGSGDEWAGRKAREGQRERRQVGEAKGARGVGGE